MRFRRSTLSSTFRHSRRLRSLPWLVDVLGVDSELTLFRVCSFNTYVRSHPDLETAVLPIRDGITVIRRRI